jgi:hypothetical protein
VSDRILFEEAWTLLRELPPPQDPRTRRRSVIRGVKDMAVAKTADSKCELLFIGEKLEPRSRLVQECLTYGEWQDEADKTTFKASSLRIPEGNYSDSIGALIIVEFARMPVDLALAVKFSALEPIVERFLQREMLSESETIGLLGELIVLKEIISNAPLEFFSLLLDGWTGFRQVARDFTFENASLEVKTTQAAESIHTINSIGQIESRIDINGVPVERLYLLSIGIIRSNSDSRHTATSLAQTCDDILCILGTHSQIADQLTEKFLSGLAAYGTSDSRRYHHPEMRDHIFAAQYWNLAFTRIYDMRDPNLSLPRRDVLNTFRDVVAGSFNFKISLPRRVSGDLNPQINLTAFVSQLIDLSR